MQILINLILVIFDEILQILKRKSLLSILCMLLVALLSINFFSSSNDDIAKINLNHSLENSVSYETLLKISGGDFPSGPSPGSPSNFPVTSGPPTPKNGINGRSRDRLSSYDPSPKVPHSASGSGSGSDPGSGSGPIFDDDVLDKNKIPDSNDFDVNEWLPDSSLDNEQCSEPESGSDFDSDSESETDSETKPTIKKDPLPVHVDFDYEMDANNRPTLLIPNFDRTRAEFRRPFNRIEFDQAASHIHHFPEFGLPLPPSFNFEHYKSLSKPDRISYALQHVTEESIMTYQNRMGRAMNKVFGTEKIRTTAVPGFVGKDKAQASLVIQNIPPGPKLKKKQKKQYYLTIVNRRNKQISSFKISQKKLEQIINDDFWVLKESNFY